MKKTYTPEQRKSHLRNLIALAMKDGQLDRREKDLLEIIAQEWGLSSDEIGVIEADPNKIEFVVPDSPDTRFAMLYDTVEMAIIDGELKRAELDICDALAHRLGFPAHAIRTIIDGILEGNKNVAAPDEIRKSVRRKLKV